MIVLANIFQALIYLLEVYEKKMNINGKNKDLDVYLEIIEYFENPKDEREKTGVFIIKLLKKLVREDDPILINNALALIKNILTLSNLLQGTEIKGLSDKEKEHLKSLLNKEFLCY